jgi:protein-S-isoprenylcysteine O-methyltransferase Ste14
MVHSLSARAVVGFVQLLLAMAAFLFLPAGTLDWWQAWAFLAVFALPVLWITVHFLAADPSRIEQHLNADGPAAEEVHTGRVVQSLAALCFIAIIVVPGIDRRFGWSEVPSWLAIAGDVLVVAGLVVVVMVFRANTEAVATVGLTPPHPLVPRGPYAVGRHPTYAGALLMAAGIPLALGSWWGLLFWVSLAGAVVARLLAEERYLADKLAGYAAYEQKVRWRLVPGLY